MDHFKNSIRHAELISRFLQQELTPEDDIELQAWLLEKPENRQWLAELSNPDLLKSELKILDAINTDGGWDKLKASMEVAAPVVTLSQGRTKWWAIAASIIVLVSLGGVLRFYFNAADEELVENANQKNEIPILPGGDKAYLTLADGKIIVLDSAVNGNLANQGSVTIIKLDGLISYNGSGNADGTVAYNTITTPRGGQFQLLLADGSKVWLNAASSFRFPTSFPGSERKVELSGEAYFEVAHNASKPFMVQVPGKIDVLVTGTSFNINAYQDEVIARTALVEGEVKLRLPGQKGNVNAMVLSPGQLANIHSTGSISISKNADLDEILAWKNGYFMFNNASVESILRQISRWYDVEVVYKGKLNEETFSGIVNRKSSISKILRIMEEGGVKFKIEENKIIVE
jgi:ferric-dicitrate binding protein FerR (iron transport regulator)